MQKAVKRQNPVFRADRMAGRMGLPGSNARSNDDIPEEGPDRADLSRGGIGSKRKHVGHSIDTPVPPVQSADATITDKRQRHRTTRAARGSTHQPTRQSRNPKPTPGCIGDRHGETPSTPPSGSHDDQESRPLFPLENDS
jgi:hypothetical protein